MPLLQNAKKALRVSKKKTENNSRVRSIVKTMVDKVRKSPTAQALADAYSALDTAVKKHLVHKNRVARVKSQLGKLVKPVQLEKTAPKKAVAKKAPAKPAKAPAATKSAAAKKGSSKTTAKK